MELLKDVASIIEELLKSLFHTKCQNTKLIMSIHQAKKGRKLIDG